MALICHAIWHRVRGGDAYSLGPWCQIAWSEDARKFGNSQPSAVGEQEINLAGRTTRKRVDPLTLPEFADPARERSPAPAVTRAIHILDLLAQEADAAISLGGLARGIGAAKSSTLNLCQVLEEGDLIVRVPGGYQLGRRNLEFGVAYPAGFNQMREFYTFCSRSTLLSHEVVQVAMLDGTEVIYLARHEGCAPMRFIAGIGSRFPAAPTAVGNALLSTLSDTEITRRFTGPQHFPRMTDHSVQTLSGLLDRVRAARKRGYSIDDNGVHPGVYGVAVVLPPWSSGDEPLAIGTSLMTSSVTPEFESQIVAELQHLVARLTNPFYLREANSRTQLADGDSRGRDGIQELP